MREPQIQIGNSDLRLQIKLLMWPGSVYSPCSDCSSRRTKEALPSKGAARIALRLFLLSLMCVTLLYPTRAGAQDNYEIQVYPSETMAPKTLLIELHSNFTVEGSTTTQFGMLPTEHQEHETIELTEGINDWSEVGFYIFTAEQSGHGVQWVGDHIRPPSANPSSLALARGSELVERIWLCQTSIFQSHLVLAVHADCGPDHWALVLVGEWNDGLECPCRSRSCRLNSPTKAGLLSRCRTPRRDLRPGGNPDLCAIKTLQLRR